MIKELFSARVYQGEFPLDDASREAMRACALDNYARYNPNGMPWSRESRHSILTAPESNGIFDALADEVRRVRPVITYLFMALYCTAKGTAFFAAINGGAGWVEAVQVAWTGADQALWAGVLNFWFIGRVFDKVRQ